MRIVLLLPLALAAACSSSTSTSTETQQNGARTIPAGPYVPGQSYFGLNSYIEYIAGNTPVVISAPHGGTISPSSIPDRIAANCGGAATTIADLNTVELARSMQQRYFARFGKYPHVILMHLARTKLDGDRTVTEAACGDANAKIAFVEWHDFIDVATNAALHASGKAWYMDMHGHGHTTQRLELGYLLSAAALNLSDANINANVAFQDTSSIRSMSEDSPLTFAQILRGPTSLGALYESVGFPAVPSNIEVRPNGDPYFTGGDDTRRHTCGAEATAYAGVTGGKVCGVQIEANYVGVRDNATNRDHFGDATAYVLQSYLLTHWGLQLDPLLK